MRGKRVTVRTPCATTGFFNDLLGRAEDLDLHRLAAQRPLELPDLGVRLPQLAGGDDVLARLHGRRCPRLCEPLPIANHAGRDVELTAELSDRFLPAQNPLDCLPLELRAEDASAVCLPPVFAHGASRRILRPPGEQSKWGALHWAVRS